MSKACEASDDGLHECKECDEKLGGGMNWSQEYNERITEIDRTWGLLTTALRNLIVAVESCDGTSQIDLNEAKAALESADRLTHQE